MTQGVGFGGAKRKASDKHPSRLDWDSLCLLSMFQLQNFVYTHHPFPLHKGKFLDKFLAG